MVWRCHGECGKRIEVAGSHHFFSWRESGRNSVRRLLRSLIEEDGRNRINVERMGFGVLANSELSDDKRGSCNVLQPVHCPRSWALLAIIPNEGGELLFQVVRYEPKGFRQRRPDGEGGWHWSLGETVRVLYRLSEVTEAVALERTIFITEGEKALDALAKLGIPATCSPGSAEKWRDEYSQYLADANRCFAEFCQDLGVKSLSAREGVIGRYLDKLIEQGCELCQG
jgi:hypothetical protein